MLRRLKAEVEKSLPPKTETILYVGELYTYIYTYMNLLGVAGKGRVARKSVFKGSLVKARANVV